MVVLRIIYTDGNHEEYRGDHLKIKFEDAVLNIVNTKTDAITMIPLFNVRKIRMFKENSYED